MKEAQITDYPKAKHKFHIHLFNDMLVVSKPASTDKLKVWYPFIHLIVLDNSLLIIHYHQIVDTCELRDLNNLELIDTGRSHCFKFSTTAAKHEFAAKNAEETVSWFKVLLPPSCFLLPASFSLLLITTLFTCVIFSNKWAIHSRQSTTSRAEIKCLASHWRIY